MVVRSTTMKRIIERVRAVGWPIEDTDEGSYVKFPDGSGGVSIHLTPSDINAPRKVMRILGRHGFYDAEAEAEKKADATRQRVIAEHKKKEAARLEKAELEAANRTHASLSLDRASGFLVDTDKVFTEHAIPVSYRVRIDAALAKRLLERNSENRPMRTAHITALARAILAGEWMETHQGIALDTGGRLVDGQHRLHAIIEADQSVPGITVPSLITCGISAATFAVVDTGRVRSASDILALQGEANTLRLASAVKLLFAHDNLPFGEWRRRKITNIEMNDYLHAFPDVREALRTSGNWSGQIGLIDSACAAGIFLVWREWGRESPVFERWWAGLCTGANLGQGDARLALRNHVSNRMNHTRRGPVHLALFIKAWNYCLTGRPVSMLAFRKDEDIQKVVGPVNEQETA